MNSKKTTVIAVIVIIVVLITLLKKDLWDTNEELLKKEITSIEKSVKTINLLDVTPFEWDVVYSFDPYTSKDTIYETVGYKWDNIRETVSEEMTQIVFLKEGKVVCYLYGYPKNNGYGIYFTSENEIGVSSASVLSVEDDLTFQVMRSEDIIYLKNY